MTNWSPAGSSQCFLVLITLAPHVRNSVVRLSVASLELLPFRFFTVSWLGHDTKDERQNAKMSF